MVNIAVFASGSGTNFETILSHIEDGSLHVNCACLIADKENAYARVRAHNHGVEEFYFNPKGYDGKAGYEAAILEVLKEKKVDLIVLSGYMRFIGHTLLSAYPIVSSIYIRLIYLNFQELIVLQMRMRQK